MQLRHCGQGEHGPQEAHERQDGHSWEDMSDQLIPGAAPVGWIAVVRPDRTVLHDGPLEAVDDIVRESLAMLGEGRPLPDSLARALRGVG